MIRTIIFKSVLGLYFLAWSPIILVGIINKSLNNFLIYVCAKGVLLVVHLVGGIKYQIHYPEKEQDEIPPLPNGNLRFDGKAIIAAKHMSILEVAILTTTIKNSFFIVKRELLWLPIYGWAFWRMGLQPVNRKPGATNMNKLTDKVAKKILKGKTLIIFPEGTRTRPGQKIKLKRGLLFLAQQLKLPILPIGTDSGKFWPKHGRIHKGTANIYFEPLLSSGASLVEIGEAINRHSA